MVTKLQRAGAAAVLEQRGRSYADELGIDIARNTPSPLYRLLTAAILYSARISAANAAMAARALADAGYTTAEKMAAATWQDRVDVLTAHGYKRYDESASRILGETAELLEHEYQGDLRRLREAAGRDPAEERKRLQAFKGMGEVGVDIFFREAQLAWEELYPFADARARAAAKRLGLPEEPAELARLVDQHDYVRLVAGLVRVDLADAYEEITGRARDA